MEGEFFVGAEPYRQALASSAKQMPHSSPKLPAGGATSVAKRSGWGAAAL
jgi:hypothetical protein